ncbi:SDR family oxidoreductase [Nocardioides panaciterrulae]|uniref:NAD(P)-dependent dehydrogenase (Short-subunit alcohol dehydrogenase family) n=1 Tax=Nocardioides panaciterrulae TaxID=661492 RepID=A0A7Y9E635_9ACTN|nr:SDR family oxidoreductase [Nocardioides panaciterrulae]NYD41627.1 NAD(P)-dependent dehydrogenase (short-subunit alcohol dehydrogenase family) [Nocardioides panaciterrulae]
MTTSDISDFTLEFFSLKGKNAIVTGGNSGLGQAFSLALATAGANVLAASIVPDDGTTGGLVQAAGARYSFLDCDITVAGNPKKVVDACVEEFGSVDILVNCAGRGINEPDVLKYGREHWDPMVALNLTAAFEMAHECAKHMVPQGSGKVINICSVFAFLGGQWSPAYAATKHGLAGFTKAYCDELAQFGVQVNAIAPGYFATALTADTQADPLANQRVLDHIPANRWGQTQDLMGATVFLASRASDYVNGHVLSVDGGYLVR